jgi:hypothetical protein
MIAGEIVLIHIEGGTIFRSWSFTTTEAKEAFWAAHRSNDEEARYLPDGTFDDPGSDTWIEIEGLIESVDGDKPLDGDMLMEHEAACGDEHNQSCTWCDAALGN